MRPTVSVMEFPLGGLDKSRSYRKQPAYPGGVYTTADALNVRGHEWQTDRARGGSRPGLSRYYQDRTHGTHSIQNINSMFLAYVPPEQTFSYFVYAGIATTGGGLGTPAGASHGTFSLDDGTFACSCWDHEEGVAYVALIDGDETPVASVLRVDPRGNGSGGFIIWDEVLSAELPDAIPGMVVIGDYVYVAWTEDLSTPVHRIYRVHKTERTIDTWLTSTTYAGLVFSDQSFNVLAAVGKYLGVQTHSSTGRFSIWDTTKTTIGNPDFTTTSQGTYNTARAAKADSDGIEFFYVSAPVNSGNVQKIKTDGTVIWSYTPVSDDNVIAYDKPAYRLCVLSRDTGVLYTVNCGTGLLQDTQSTPGGSALWDEVGTDWRGNIILWKNSVASNDIVALDSEFSVIWGPTTFANTDHSRATILRDPDFVVPPRNRLIVTSGGRVHRVVPATYDPDTGFELTPIDITAVTTNPNSLDPNRPVVFSAQNGLYLYFVDGGTYRYYNPYTDAMVDWTATAGSMPVDSTGGRARLICTWNGRTVLAGFRNDPQNIYFSAVDDPTDHDTSPAFTTATQAYVLNASNMGTIGQRVTALIPFSDDVLIVGCDGSIWQITGDPMAGGRIDNLSRETGIAWGQAWCFGPGKMIYFFSTRGGVYSVMPGQSPERVSQAISDDLYRVNTSEEKTSISMAWDDRAQGLYVFIASLNERQRCTHYFYDKRYNAWWPVEFADTDFNPKCCYAYDGDLVDDKIVLIGSWDSHVRAPDQETGTDDGQEFQSYVALGPLISPGDAAELRLDELQGMMGLDSDAVEYHIAAANEPQAALATLTKGDGGFTGDWDGQRRAGTWFGGRNPTHAPRTSAFAQYIYIRGLGRWALEGVRVALAHMGPTRGRGF